MPNSAARVDPGREKQSSDFVSWVGSIGLHNLAIVFTDIIDSTRLNNELGDAEWDRIRSAHFERARELLRSHHGCLVKTIGDAVMAAFRNSIDALRFVIELESNTGHEVVCIRAGVHVGEVQVKEGDTFGAEVNFAARVSSKPEKGGIWVSESVHEKWLRHDPRAELEWTRHEGVELKGFDGAFTLWSLPPSKSQPLSTSPPLRRPDTAQRRSAFQRAPSRLSDQAGASFSSARGGKGRRIPVTLSTVLGLVILIGALWGWKLWKGTPLDSMETYRMQVEDQLNNSDWQDDIVPLLTQWKREALLLNDRALREMLLQEIWTMNEKRQILARPAVKEALDKAARGIAEARDRKAAASQKD